MRGNSRYLTTLVAVAFLALPVSRNVTAQSQTIMAKGSVTVPGESCNFALPNPDDWCHSGGSGAKISFSFEGEVLTPGSSAPVPATGNFQAYFPETGYRVQAVAGTALIFPNLHQLSLNGTCETRDALGQIVAFASGPCGLFASDRTSNGAVDSVSLFVSTVSGYIQACCEPASGNVNIE